MERLIWVVPSVATLLSPLTCLIFLIPQERHRIGIFLLLAMLPGAWLLFALSHEAFDIYNIGVMKLYAESLILSLVFTLLGIALMMKVEPKTRAFFVSLFGMIVASSPLLFTLTFFIIVMITPAPAND